MIVNLNVMCKVKLNELGKVIWLSQVDSLPEDIKNDRLNIVASIQNAIKDDNTLETELWSIMNIFGPYITLSLCPLILQQLNSTRIQTLEKYS